MLSRNLACCALLLSACGVGYDPTFTHISQDAVFTNGNSLNGNSLNGNSLNGNSLNGSPLGSAVAAVYFDGAYVKGNVPLDSAGLSGTVFWGTHSSATFSGWQFEGARFTGTTDNGSTINLRIDDIDNESWPNNDVWEYYVSYFFPPDGRWYSLCVDRDGDPVPAIPVNGRWSHDKGVPGGGAKIDDPSAFTFACKGQGAIAKCVFPIGYKPWKKVNGVSLDRWHQACVRLLRGDFCGDGNSYTQNGSRVNLYDNVGVQRDTNFWLFESEWDENGARCFNPLNRSHALVAPCFYDRAISTCGLSIDFWLGTLLMNETPLPILQ